MTKNRAEVLLGILQEHYRAREDGWMWLACYDDGAETGIVEQIEGEYDDAQRMATSLAMIINEGSPELGYLMLCRGEARPKEMDRELWRALRDQASPEKLVDMVVFNADRAWSMRREDADAARASSS